MTTESSSSVAENLEQQIAKNSDHLKTLIDQQYNVEVTRSIALFFSCTSEDCARALTKALFAKGTRVLTPEPEHTGDRFSLHVGVKRSLRDTVREDFTKDMVETAVGMNGTYDGWDLLTDEAAEETQAVDAAEAR
jgi:5-formyltetrahydrofolate cyclo-ligase